jgi:hypothetical protein
MALVRRESTVQEAVHFWDWRRAEHKFFDSLWSYLLDTTGV